MSCLKMFDEVIEYSESYLRYLNHCRLNPHTEHTMKRLNNEIAGVEGLIAYLKQKKNIMLHECEEPKSHSELTTDELFAQEKQDIYYKRQH